MSVASGIASVADVGPHFEATRAAWLAAARAVAAQLGRGGAIVTVDDVRRACPPPATSDGRVMGAVFRTGDWVCVGYARSVRRTCHHRHIAQFRLR